MNILVSACLLGFPCRYDGAAKPNDAVLALAKRHTLIPFCPEIYGGLPTPRPPCELRAGRVVTADGEDKTDAYTRGADEALALCRLCGCKSAILKENSPSCGSGAVYNGTFSRHLTAGDGLTAARLKTNGIAVYGENFIDDFCQND